MALEAGGRKYCKVIFTENGKSVTRRMHTMKVQAADGRLHVIEGEHLPEEMTFNSGVLYRGAHLGEVFLNPEDAKASPLLPPHTGVLSKRDATFILLGMFMYGLIFFLSQHAAIALS